MNCASASGRSARRNGDESRRDVACWLTASTLSRPARLFGRRTRAGRPRFPKHQAAKRTLSVASVLVGRAINLLEVRAPQYALLAPRAGRPASSSSRGDITRLGMPSSVRRYAPRLTNQGQPLGPLPRTSGGGPNNRVMVVLDSCAVEANVVPGPPGTEIFAEHRELSQPGRRCRGRTGSGRSPAAGVWHYPDRQGFPHPAAQMLGMCRGGIPGGDGCQSNEKMKGELWDG